MRQSRTFSAGPRHPANALAGNHSDEVKLVHPAMTEADSKNGSEPARPRPVSKPPRRLRPDLARAHLLYGEWLYRQPRCGEARGPLRTAHDLLEPIVMKAFAAQRKLGSVLLPAQRNALGGPVPRSAHA
jgi:hypothetical protein